MTTEIPHPTGLPLLGNLRDVDSELPIVSLSQLADTYGILCPSISRWHTLMYHR